MWSTKPNQRREIIFVRGQSYVSVFQNIDSPLPSPPGGGGGEDILAARRKGWGVNILEDERHRIALLQ